MSIFSIFLKKGPQNADEEYSRPSSMLTQDQENPTIGRELLDPKKLDHSIESLSHIDVYLEHIHKDTPEGNDYLRVVLRCGAYVGEVMRKHSSKDLHWLTYEEAAKRSESIRSFEYSIASAGIILHESDSFSFPLGKMCKFTENGSEDSVYLFAKVLLEKDANQDNAL